MTTQWKKALVEKPFRQQLKVMGCRGLEGDTDVPELTHHPSFCERTLKGRLRAALKNLDLRNRQPWFGDAYKALQAFTNCIVA
jgi:hypothetical protein